jgi:hypothetical protein
VNLGIRHVPFPKTPEQVELCLDLASEHSIAIERDNRALIVIMPVEEYTRLTSLEETAKLQSRASGQSSGAGDHAFSGEGVTPALIRHARLKTDNIEVAYRLGTEDDVARLSAALAADGIIASSDDIYAAWRRHSDDYAASWLVLGDDDEALRRALLRHLEV